MGRKFLFLPQLPVPLLPVLADCLLLYCLLVGTDPQPEPVRLSKQQLRQRQVSRPQPPVPELSRQMRNLPLRNHLLLLRLWLQLQRSGLRGGFGPAQDRDPGDQLSDQTGQLGLHHCLPQHHPQRPVPPAAEQLLHRRAGLR